MRTLQIRIRLYEHRMREHVRLALTNGQPAQARHAVGRRTTILRLERREEICADGQQ